LFGLAVACATTASARANPRSARGNAEGAVDKVRGQFVAAQTQDVGQDANLDERDLRIHPAGDAVRGVQSHRLPDDSRPAFIHAPLAQEPRGQIGAVDLESLLAVALLGQPDVVQDTGQDTGEEQQLVVVVLERPPPSQLARVEVAGHAVSGHERGLDLSGEPVRLSGHLRLRHGEPGTDLFKHGRHSCSWRRHPQRHQPSRAR